MFWNCTHCTEPIIFIWGMHFKLFLLQIKKVVPLRGSKKLISVLQCLLFWWWSTQVLHIWAFLSVKNMWIRPSTIASTSTRSSVGAGKSIVSYDIMYTYGEFINWHWSVQQFFGGNDLHSVGDCICMLMFGPVFIPSSIWTRSMCSWSSVCVLWLCAIGAVVVFAVSSAIRCVCRCM